ncbi:hypothetical protein [Nocardioides seonyuensis]|nr:hypothetical protein [Nocardioides seonyuensis]
MKLFKSAVVLGAAKKLYDEAQKPENQRRIKETVDKVRTRAEEKKRRR